MNKANSSKINWTPEQKLAIDLSGGNVLVTAAAGSGKTAVLTERILRKLLSKETPGDIRRFVVVTFTKPAAAEMKSRLSKKLNEYIRNNPSDKHAKLQLMYVHEANISTIDSFCLSLIEKYQSSCRDDIGFMPGMRILSEADEKLLLDKAIGEAIEAEYEKPDQDFFALLDAFDTSKTGNDTNVRSAVGSLYRILRLSPERKKLREQMLSSYGENYWTLRENSWFSDIFNNISLATEFFIKRADAILSEEIEEPQYEKLISTFTAALNAIKSDAERLGIAAQEKDYVKCREVIFSGMNEVSTRRDKKHCYKWCSAVHFLKEDFKEFWAESAKSLSSSEQELREEGERLTPLIEKLFDIVEVVESKYTKLKKERNTWDFSDIELRAKDILWEENENGELIRSKISREVGEAYDEILIDEYQDVNDLQELIFRGICSEEENNIFMVGDVKQSIYGFRGAVPELFLQKREEYCAACTEDSEFPAKVALNANFRSRREITTAVNAVFNAIMKKESCEMDYAKDDELNPSSEFPPSKTAGAYFTLIDKVADKDEASYVASKIKNLIDTGALVKGEKEGEMRPLKYSDIAILVRSRKSDAGRFYDALSDAGIPVTDPATSGFLSLPSVKRIIAVLCAIDNPMKDINLVAAMSSGVFGFTESELIRIRQSSDGAFYYAVKAAAESGDEKAEKFLEKLELFRRKSMLLTAERFISYLYKTTGYTAFVKTLPNGKKEYEALMLLKEYAGQFGAGGRQDLSGYVSHLENLISKGEAGEGKIKTGDNEVKILTLHKSKGLEFPVCFIVCASKTFNNDDAKKVFLAEPSIGVGLKLSLPSKNMLVNTAARKAVLRKIKEKQLREEMRLLYVGMTRAKERLEIVATVKNPDERVESSMNMLDSAGRMENYSVRTARSFVDWLLPVAMGTNAFILGRNYSWEISAPEKREAAEVSADDELTERIRRSINSQYPFAAATSVPTKITVSDIVAAKSAKEDIEYCCERKPACIAVAGNNAAEAGTALHAFLQFADYSKLTDTEGEIERLVSERFITERQAQLIDRRKLNAFASSELLSRILKSESVTREFRFTFSADAADYIPDAPNEKLLVQGAIDCIFEENGRCIVVDYKTDRIRNGNISQKASYYAPQLEIYARGLKELTGKEVSEKILYFLDADEAVHVL